MAHRLPAVPNASKRIYWPVVFPSRHGREFPTHNRQTRAACFLFAVCLATLFVPGFARGQGPNIQYTNNTSDQTLRSDLRVDPSTLGMSLQIPLANYPGRAGMGVPLGLNYNSKVWRIEFDDWVNGNLSNCSHPPPDEVGLECYTTTRAVFAERSVAGWTFSSPFPTIDYGDERYNSSGWACCTGDPNQGYYIARMTVRFANGSTNELRKSDTPQAGADPMTGTYYAVDSSRLRFNGTSPGAGTLYLPDGSHYDFGNYSATRYVDRNGNVLEGQLDTLGRQLVAPSFHNGFVHTETHAISGVNGVPLNYSFELQQLGNSLAPDMVTGQVPALRRIGDMDKFGNNVYGPSLFTSSSVGRVIEPYTFNPVVLHKIILPNGTAYTFTYNEYGEIAKVVYPTGGCERFRYDFISPLSSIGEPYSQANRGVVERRVSANGTGSDEVTWQYVSTGAVVTTLPDGTRTVRMAHTGSSAGSVVFGFDDPRAGMVYDERVLAPQAQGGAMLQRTLAQWDYTAGPGTAKRNPRVTRRIEILLDTGGNALAKTTVYQHDADLNVIRTEAYPFIELDQGTAQSASLATIAAIWPGTLMRSSEATFLVNDPAIDANTRGAYRARNLLGLPTSARIRDGLETIVAQSQINYDEPAYPLLSYGAVTGWIDPATNVRGNPTTAASWLNTTGTYLQTHMQYDQCGSARNVWDAKGNQSQIEYSSEYAYAYPTLSRTAVPDPSGQYGASVAFETRSTYDVHTGLITAIVDANNVTTTIEYTDVLNRPSRMVRASGTSVQNQTSIGYDDTNHIVTTTSDQNSYNDNLLLSKVLYDGLGRTTETRQYEGGANYIAVQQQYDALGRVFKTSNPFRQSETPRWTTTGFDFLGRVISMTTPDLAVVATTYSGNQVLVTDQVGRKRMSRTNALGQLKDVWEITTNNSTQYPGIESVSFSGQSLNGYHTSYSYDSLDDLTNVTQGSQTRTFAYDSLKRLKSATNPESGTICYGTVEAGQCQANGYDANGDLIYKTDARGIRSTYAYDALGRNTSVTYTNDPAATPTVHRYYDGWKDGASSNIPYSKGKLWQTETTGATGSRTTTNSFDALSRPTSQSQRFYANSAWSQPFSVSATYDRANHMLTQTYPSGHVVNYAYDSAGRTISFSGNLGDGTAKTYSNGIVYAPFGAMTKERFGTDTPIFNKLFYNQRGQLAEIRESTSYTGPNDTNNDRGAIVNFYSVTCWGMCWDATNGHHSMTDNNGNLRRQEIYVPHPNSTDFDFFAQSYDYDDLNRLEAVSEKFNGTGNDTLKQTFTYDRWGNRRIAQTINLPNPEYTVDPSNNRLIAPAGYTHDYDAAGNQTRDTYTTNSPTAGYRTYDAENRIIAAQKPVSGKVSWAYYFYNGDGQRVRRKIATYEIWQVYGFDGELVAEYPQTGPSMAVAQPQKEYGYRNGQLLVTTEPFINLAWNKPATQTDNYNATTTAAKAVDGDVDGVLDNGHASATDTHPNSWWQVDLQSVQTIDSLTVWGRTDDCCPQQSSDFYVLVSDNPFTSNDLNTTLNQAGVSNYYHAGFAGPSATTGPTSINVNRTGRYVRVQLAGANYLALGEVQVWSQAAKVNWLVTDQLGTPRIIFDKTGSPAGVSRHDYLPFGEEIFADTAGRTTAQRYSAADGVRQKFTDKERDNETGLDYFTARYFSSTQGRFISVDPVIVTPERFYDPQQFNLYAVRNNPLAYTDPTGERIENSSAENKLTDSQLKELRDSMRQDTGLQSIDFDPKTGQFSYDKAEVAIGGSVDIREAITGAIDDQKNVFKLGNGPTKIDFVETDEGTLDPNSGVTTYNVSFDFNEMSEAESFGSDKEALEAFSWGTNLYHEIDHKESYDPSSPISNKGIRSNEDTVAHVNVAQGQLGRFLRESHSAQQYKGPVARYQGTSELRFKNAAGKVKILRWQSEK